MSADPDVLILGASLAGLCCGRRLAQCGVAFRILEASDGVGGRVRSDVVHGFTLDRGFQVFRPSDPEARRVLDYGPLDLKPFARGAILRTRGTFHRIGKHSLSMGATIPSLGMQTIPSQIAARLPDGSVSLNAEVASLRRNEVCLTNGEKIQVRGIVVAVDGAELARLTNEEAPTTPSLGDTTIYFAADHSPVNGPIFVMDGDRTGPINLLIVLTEASLLYAPGGKSLISATMNGVPSTKDSEFEQSVRQQLGGWYGNVVRDWKLLRIDRISNPPLDQPLVTRLLSVRWKPGLYVCSDGSIDEAMTSGFRTAQAVMADLSNKII